MSIMTGMFIIIQFFIVSCIVMILTVDSLPHKVKVNFVLAFVFFSISFFCEYASIEAYNWNLSNPRVFLTTVKVIEHTCSPLSLFFVTNVASRRGRLHWVFTLPLMTINGVFDLISAITGWTFSFDENCVYHRGDFYFIFILVIGGTCGRGHRGNSQKLDEIPEKKHPISCRHHIHVPCGLHSPHNKP